MKKMNNNFAFANKVEITSTAHVVQRYLDQSISPVEIFTDQLFTEFGQELENVRVHKEKEEFMERIKKIRDAQISAVGHILKNEFYVHVPLTDDQKAVLHK